MKQLYFIPDQEFRRIVNLSLPPCKKTEIFAALARLNTLYMIARAGSGHIGSSFSSMDIFAWLYLNELQDNDIFFSSKGHDAPGLYSVLIGLGKLPFDNIHKLRRLNGLPGHPDIMTECIHTNTGSLGMGVSKAKGIVLADRHDERYGRVYVLTGDGELQEGQFWESLQGAANQRIDEITVIIDHNKIQSDTWIENVSDLGDLEAKFAGFGWHVQRCNGNDMEQISKAIETARAVNGQPQVIIADTIKGYGVSFMQNIPQGGEFYSFHSGAPSVEDYGCAVKELMENANKLLSDAGQNPLVVETAERGVLLAPGKNIQKLIGAYERKLLEIGGAQENVIVMDADLMIDCGLLSFRNAYPDRFTECGIAEQDMVSQAGAMALKGKLPIVHSFACFLAPRANEQIFNNSSERSKIIYTGSLAGLLPAGPGHSHQMVRDISVLSSIPGLTLLEPCCESEVAMVLDYAINKNPSSTYIRLVSIPRSADFQLPDGYELSPGKGVALTSGEDAILFTYGLVMVSEACKAAVILEKEYGIGLKVINLPWLNKFDADWMMAEIGNIEHVITLDNHLLDGGQGEKIGAVLAEQGIDGKTFRRMGLVGIPECGNNDEVLDYHGLDAQEIARVVRKT